MKVWCSRDADGERVVWNKKPDKIMSGGMWQPHPKFTENWHDVIIADAGHIRDGVWKMLFPKGIKKGQCVKCTLKRLEVDDG